MACARGKRRAGIAASAEGAINEHIAGLKRKPAHHLVQQYRNVRGAARDRDSRHDLPPFASIWALTMRARRGSAAPLVSSRMCGFQISKEIGRATLGESVCQFG